MTNPPVFPGNGQEPVQPQGQQPQFPQQPYPEQPPAQQAPTEQYPANGYPSQQNPSVPGGYPTEQFPQAPGGFPTEQYPQAPGGFPTEQYPAAPSVANPTEQYPAQGYGQQPSAAVPDINGQYPAQYQNPNPGFGQDPNLGYPQDPNGFPGYAAAPMPPKKSKKGLFIGLGVTAGVLLIGGIGVAVAANALTESHRPELKVEAYLDSLVAGKAEAALKLSGGYDGEASTELLTDEVYEGATARLDSYDVKKITTNGTKSTISVDLTDSDGQETSQTFTLKSTGKEFLFYDLWKLDTVRMDAITAAVNGPEGYGFTVNGVEVAGEVLGAAGAAVFPGTYEVAATVSKYYTVDEPQPLTAGIDGATQAANFSIGLSADGEQAATDAVYAFIDTCAAAQAADPAGCPFRAITESQYSYTNWRWSLAAKPNLEFGAWNGDSFNVSSDEAGSVTGYATVTNPANGLFLNDVAFTSTRGFSVNGTISGIDESGTATFTSGKYY